MILVVLRLVRVEQVALLMIRGDHISRVLEHERLILADVVLQPLVEVIVRASTAMHDQLIG